MINFVVALPSEAKPLISHYRLTLQPHGRGFPLYVGTHLRLVVTGMGKVQVAAGTAFLAGINASHSGPWLNIGIAGHRSLPVGTATYASKITDQASGRSWYPPQIVNMPGTAAHVVTSDRPVLDYPESVVCEMEAAAFYATATRFVSGELVQCCKIISDNARTDIADITPDSTAELIGDHREDIDRAVQALRGLADQNSVHATDLEQFCARWHFTATQKVQLCDALHKASVRGAKEMMEVGRWLYCRSAKCVLAEMDRCLQSLPVTL